MAQPAASLTCRLVQRAACNNGTAVPLCKSLACVGSSRFNRRGYSNASRGSSFASSTSFPTSHNTPGFVCNNGRYYATASSEAKILCETKEHSPGHNVATISVSNPSKLNIVNSGLIQELIQTCETLSKDDALRAVILTGAPTAAGKSPSFIGGADIREMSQMSSYESAHRFITIIHNGCQALRKLPVPVIARVNGFCLGAGMEIAASCDLRIGTKDSRFGMPEVKIGLPSIVEAAYLPTLIGWGRARRFLYLAENIDGTMAEEWGLIERLVEDEAALDRAVQEWTDMLVAMGPKCIRAQKRLMQRWENSTVDEAVEMGVDGLAQAFADGGKEPKEYMQKFLGRKR